MDERNIHPVIVAEFRRLEQRIEAFEARLERRAQLDPQIPIPDTGAKDNEHESEAT